MKILLFCYYNTKRQENAPETELIEGSVFDFDTPSTRKGNPNNACIEVIDSNFEDAAIMEHGEKLALLA